jgi:hypothetical protein
MAGQAAGLLLALVLGVAGLARASSPANSRVVLDMVQNNPGDAVAWQASKYIDPDTLRGLGYTGQVATGELSGALAVDFSSLEGVGPGGLFPAGTPRRAWLDAFGSAVARAVARAKTAGVQFYFFVDLLVFPKALLEAFPSMTDHRGQVVWNDVTKRMLGVMVRETFRKFGDGVDGWVVRTGETYVYDTPFHVGNSPSNGTMARWVEFITTLRDLVCVQHGKKLFMRAWDNWPSDTAYYLNMTTQIPVHPNLYFSVKHSAGDFVRPAVWNPTLGTGTHAQIVEVELQREYEGKGAVPNYVMAGIVDGFPEMGPTPADRVGLSSVVNASQIRGLWTWTRGGGWWGPYLHAKEIWIDLHARVLVRWWAQRGAMSEPDVFRSVVPELFPGCDDAPCVEALRELALQSADMVLRGQWGTVPSCGTWMRDDRMGGLEQLGCFNGLGANDTLWRASIAEMDGAAATATAIKVTFEHRIRPYLRDPEQIETVQASVEYASRLYDIIAAAWPVLRQAFCVKKNLTLPMRPPQLEAALARYDAAWSAFRAFGLANTHAASLYHPYYLCLGTTCNGGFDPPPADMQAGSIYGKNSFGIGHTVDSLRAVSSMPPGQLLPVSRV